MPILKVPLNDQELEMCSELRQLTGAASNSEVVQITLIFFVEKIIPVYERGAQLFLRSPNGPEVAVEWTLKRDLPSSKVAHNAINSDSIDVRLNEVIITTIDQYVPGRDPAFRPSFARFSLAAFYSAISHYSQGWKLIGKHQGIEQEVPLNLYFRPPSPSIVKLGGLRQ